MSEDNIYSGLKVLDIASWIAAPSATTILADYGAEVIKVEPPGAGDPYRILPKVPPNPVATVNYSWHLTNRNKRGMALDLKSPASRDVLTRLVKWADVLVTNYPRKARESLKLTYADVSPLNAKLIYADVTGYGHRGAEADLPGFDVTAYWARSGLMASTHDAGSAPTLPVPGIGDHATATTLYASIATALYRRERTGKGAYVTASLLAEGIWAAATWVQGALAGGKFFGSHDRLVPSNALLNPYRTSDDRWFLLVAPEPKEWERLARVIGREDLLADPRFSDARKQAANAKALAEIVDQIFSSQPLKYWRDALDKARIPYGVVQTPSELAHDPQVIANELVVPLEGGPEPLKLTVSSPVVFEGVQKVKAFRAPDVGEHNDVVLAELGYSPEEIQALQQQGAIPAADGPKAAAGGGR
jgi:crotonobetainyl-CoA:carnitine CoA-transferase CaiB-like acyl-CoA transferase